MKKKTMNLQLDDHTIRVATIDDLPIATKILSESFKHDPLTNWLIEKSKNKNKLEITVDYLVHEVYKSGYVLITHDNMGAALWETEVNEPIGWDLLKRNLKFLFKQGIPTVNRILKDRKICKEHFPKHGAYFYLGMVGVLPEARGKGLASKLMNPILDYCKINNLPAYLETANSTNVDIYKKKGFTITEIISKNNLNVNYMKFE